MSERFKVAPYGTVAWIWTIVYLLAMIYFAGLAISDIVNGYIPDPIIALFAIVLVPLMIYAWLRSVRGYRLEGDHLIVDRAGPGKINISLANIDNVNGSPDLGSFFNRSFLSLGGVFGWSGKVGVRKAQDVTTLDAEAYGTNSNKMVLLEMKDGRKIILTPQDPQAMETSLRIAGVALKPAPGPATSAKPRAVKTAKRK